MNRTKVAASRFPEANVCFVLLFWEDEQKDECLPSSSTYFVHGTVVKKLVPMQHVRLRDDSMATVIAVSEDKNDIMKLQERLEKKLSKSDRVRALGDSLIHSLNRTSMDF